MATAASGDSRLLEGHLSGGEKREDGREMGSNKPDIATDTAADEDAIPTKVGPPDKREPSKDLSTPTEDKIEEPTESDEVLAAIPPEEDPNQSPRTKDSDAENSKTDPETHEKIYSSDDDSVDERAEARRVEFDDFYRRRQLAPKRRKQYNQYVNILEERIAMLESRFDDMDRSLGNPPMDAPLVVPHSAPRHEPGLNFQFWSSFAQKDSKHMIDVLVGEPYVVDLRKSKRRNDWSRFGVSSRFPESLGDRSAEKATAVNELDLEAEVQKLRGNALPERIRINATAILILLSKVLGFIYHPQPNVILRPFKAFLHNERQLRDTLKETLAALDEMILKRHKEALEDDNSEVSHSEKIDGEYKRVTGDQVDNTKSEALSGQRRSGKEERADDSISAGEWTSVLTELDLFHCQDCTLQIHQEWPNISDVKASFDVIYDLLENYIKPLNTKLRGNTAEKVRFCDLWHLFYTGDEVIANENPKNEEDNIAGKIALRVLKVSGGRRVLTTVNPYDSGLKIPPTYQPQPPPPPPPPPLQPGPSLPGDMSRSKGSNNQHLALDEYIRTVDGFNAFCVHAYYLDFDGSKLVPVRRRFIIYPYTEEREIRSLPLYPIQYASDKDTRRNALKERGQKFIKYANPGTITYLNCVGTELRNKEELNDKVIVDMREFYRLEKHQDMMPRFSEPETSTFSEDNDCVVAGCMCSPTSSHHIEWIAYDHHVENILVQEYRAARSEFKPAVAMKDTDLTSLTDWNICHYRLFAYKLRSREWVAVDVDNLEPPKASELNMGFQQLVLPSDHKIILESQVREHFRKRGVQSSRIATEDDMDIVRGKGQGLILLLHGAPGVGKTATAECIADLVEKPLYPITCGDLGSTAEDVEWNLKKHFTLASKWDCVMLLDEADVFLAKRRQADLQRNSIVSVFLRMLEYYKGLLFLTTNRVGTFDEAFKSRVHISLFYPNFDRETTMRVWKTFIKQTKRALKRNNRTGIQIDKDGILAFAMDHWDEHPDARWNGRQIRNAFHTAVSMAEFKARVKHSVNGEYNQERDVKIKVGRSQFERIANTIKEFDDYMLETMGTSYEAKAAKERMRARSLDLGKKSKKATRNLEEEESSSEESEEQTAKSKKSKKKQQQQKSKIDEDSTEEERGEASTKGRGRSKKSRKKVESSEEIDEVSKKGKSKKRYDSSSADAEEVSNRGKEHGKSSKEKQRQKKDQDSSSDE